MNEACIRQSLKSSLKTQRYFIKAFSLDSITVVTEKTLQELALPILRLTFYRTKKQAELKSQPVFYWMLSRQSIQ